jgi:hypothetical protein
MHLTYGIRPFQVRLYQGACLATAEHAHALEDMLMSKYLAIPAVTFREPRLLLAALASLGYTDVEQGEALRLFGYQGDHRSETAEIVVRRRHLGRASNDLGFTRTPAGLIPVISEYDQRTLHGGQFLVQLRTAYSEQVVEEVRRRLLGTARRTVEGGVVTIRVRY